MTHTWTGRRIVALGAMLVAAVLSLVLIDGRVLRTMREYQDQPRKVVPQPTSSDHRNEKQPADEQRVDERLEMDR